MPSSAWDNRWTGCTQQRTPREGTREDGDQGQARVCTEDAAATGPGQDPAVSQE